MWTDSIIKREKKTVEVLIRIYCNNHHHKGNKLCRNCEGLLEYAHVRLDNCPFRDNKPACVKCTVHCYQSSVRTKIISVMRYAGPRMLFKHPILALLHIINCRKKLNKDRLERGWFSRSS